MDKREVKDRRVLSVPAAISYALMTEHNVYSCPEDWPVHDLGVDAFAPRKEKGKIPRIYRIAARIVTDPLKPVLPPTFDPSFAQSIISYISVAKLRKGILDEGGKYRFYILSDVERGALDHMPVLSVPGPSHVYLSLKELLSGSAVVHPIQNLS